MACKPRIREVAQTMQPDDKLVDADIAAVRREYTPPADKTLPI